MSDDEFPERIWMGHTGWVKYKDSDYDVEEFGPYDTEYIRADLCRRAGWISVEDALPEVGRRIWYGWRDLNGEWRISGLSHYGAGDEKYFTHWVYPPPEPQP